jgi:hypothetical protein
LQTPTKTALRSQKGQEAQRNQLKRSNPLQESEIPAVFPHQDRNKMQPADTQRCKEPKSFPGKKKNQSSMGKV